MPERDAGMHPIRHRWLSFAESSPVLYCSVTDAAVGSEAERPNTGSGEWLGPCAAPELPASCATGSCACLRRSHCVTRSHDAEAHRRVRWCASAVLSSAVCIPPLSVATRGNGSRKADVGQRVAHGDAALQHLFLPSRHRIGGNHRHHDDRPCGRWFDSRDHRDRSGHHGLYPR